MHWTLETFHKFPVCGLQIPRAPLLDVPTGNHHPWLVQCHWQDTCYPCELPLWTFFIVQLQLSSFFPITLPCPTHSHLPHSVLPPPLALVVLVHGSFIHVPWPFPFFTLLSPCPAPSGHCQFVLYFHVFGSTLLACLFCWLGSTYSWDHMVSIFQIIKRNFSDCLTT